MSNIWEYRITEKTQRILEQRMLKYMRGMRRTHKVSSSLLEAWAKRYYISMLVVLQKQGKH